MAENSKVECKPPQLSEQPFFACGACHWRGTIAGAKRGRLAYYSCPQCGKDAHPAPGRLLDGRTHDWVPA